MKNCKPDNPKDSSVLTCLLPPGYCVSLDQVSRGHTLLRPDSQGEKRWWEHRACMNGWPQHKDPAPGTERRLKILFNSQPEIIPFDPGGGTIALLGKLAGRAVAHSVPVVWKMSTGRPPACPNHQSLGHWFQSNYHYLHSRGVCPTGFICTEVSLKIFMNVTYIS